MSTGTMSAEEVSLFLKTGNLHLDGDQLNDNYDWALYRPISPEAYQAVLSHAQIYFRTEERFQSLYTRWALADLKQKKLYWHRKWKRVRQDRTLPLYIWLYTNNCDHAARELAGAADDAMQNYNLRTWHRTPNGNLKAFGHAAPSMGRTPHWGKLSGEKLLEFL